MIVISQKGDLVFEFSKAINFSTDPNGGVYVKFPNGESNQIGIYDCRDHARHVLGTIVAASIEDQARFDIPDRIEIRSLLMNRHSRPIRRTAISNSHGGS